jgi:hypothetical protein
MKSLDSEKMIQIVQNDTVEYNLYTCPECVQFTLEEALNMINETSFIINTLSYNNTEVLCD